MGKNALPLTGGFAQLRGRALWERQGESNSKFREIIQIINLEVARHRLGIFR